MKCGAEREDQIDFLVYCLSHAHSVTPLFTGETLAGLFNLACRPKPDWLEDEDRVYEFFTADQVIELVSRAKTRLNIRVLDCG